MRRAHGNLQGKDYSFPHLSEKEATAKKQNKTKQNTQKQEGQEDGGEISGTGVHFPSAPVKRLADLRNRVNTEGIPACMKIGDQRL